MENIKKLVRNATANDDFRKDWNEVRKLAEGGDDLWPELPKCESDVRHLGVAELICLGWFYAGWVKGREGIDG